ALPTGHTVHSTLPVPGASVPGGHSVQFFSPGMLVNVPGGHGLQSKPDSYSPLIHWWCDRNTLLPRLRPPFSCTTWTRRSTAVPLGTSHTILLSANTALDESHEPALRMPWHTFSQNMLPTSTKADDAPKYRP